MSTNTFLKKQAAKSLKTKLIESGTTQTEVAEKVGVSLAYIKPSRVFELVDGFGIFYRNRRR